MADKDKPVRKRKPLVNWKNFPRCQAQTDREAKTESVSLPSISTNQRVGSQRISVTASDRTPQTSLPRSYEQNMVSGVAQRAEVRLPDIAASQRIGSRDISTLRDAVFPAGERQELYAPKNRTYRQLTTLPMESEGDREGWSDTFTGHYQRLCSIQTGQMIDYPRSPGPESVRTSLTDQQFLSHRVKLTDRRTQPQAEPCKSRSPQVYEWCNHRTKLPSIRTDPQPGVSTPSSPQTYEQYMDVKPARYNEVKLPAISTNARVSREELGSPQNSSVTSTEIYEHETPDMLTPTLTSSSSTSYEQGSALSYNNQWDNDITPNDTPDEEFALDPVRAKELDDLMKQISDKAEEIDKYYEDKTLTEREMDEIVESTEKEHDMLMEQRELSRKLTAEEKILTAAIYETRIDYKNYEISHAMEKAEYEELKEIFAAMKINFEDNKLSDPVAYANCLEIEMELEEYLLGDFNENALSPKHARKAPPKGSKTFLGASPSGVQRNLVSINKRKQIATTVTSPSPEQAGSKKGSGKLKNIRKTFGRIKKFFKKFFP